ncbi:MAG TPA: aspartyl protease family protein [Candidatus Angelobacter sp.]|jgi:tetratricopeptide (TPR) repeat protein
MNSKKRANSAFCMIGSRKYPQCMRSLVVTKLWWLLIVLVLASQLVAEQGPTSADALSGAHEIFSKADFQGAAAAFQKIIETNPSAEAYSGLVRSLLKADDVKAADESSQKALAALPESALVHSARGDVYFRRGRIPEAEDEYKAALKLDDKSSRAWLGQGKIDSVYTRHSKSKAAIAKAHELDPTDGDALYEWAIRLPYPDNVRALEKHLAEYHNDPDEERHEREYMEFVKAIAGRKVWVPAREVERTEIKMELLTIGTSLARRGYGLRVRLNDRSTVTLLLDTGASGVIITRKLAEKIGARKLSEQGIEGVGKSGPANGYKAWVDKITIGDLEFHDCFVHATPREITEVDGTIGTDVFAKYLITLDIPGRKLRLEPLPAAPQPDAETQIGSFSRAFSFGHFLLVPTEVGKKAAGLFVIDSGANANTISPEQARLVPEMRAFNVQVSGASGTVNSAFIADNATLRFANVHPSGERISTVDLHSVSKSLGTEISGQIGFSAMEEMRVSINYRDGLVQFVGK